MGVVVGAIRTGQRAEEFGEPTHRRGCGIWVPGLGAQPVVLQEIERRHQDKAARIRRVLKGSNDGKRATVDPSEALERRVNEERITRFHAKRSQVPAERIERMCPGNGVSPADDSSLSVPILARKIPPGMQRSGRISGIEKGSGTGSRGEYGGLDRIRSCSACLAAPSARKHPKKTITPPANPTYRQQLAPGERDKQRRKDLYLFYNHAENQRTGACRRAAGVPDVNPDESSFRAMRR